MEGFQGDSSQPCVCIGSKLRLLSQLKVRYEGTLYSVDTQKSTISLKNVKTFGTEGRGIEGNEVPGSDEIFEMIVFRAADISEIFMIEAPNAVSVDPAIVDYQQTREKQNAANTTTGGHNVTSVSDSRVSTPGPESIQSGDVHHVPRHDSHNNVGNKWGNDDNRVNERENAWGGQRGGHYDRRQNDGRRDRDGFGDRNGPYSSVDRRINNGGMRPYPNRNASYGYNDGNSRQASGRQHYGQQSSYYDHDRYRDNGVGRGGYRDQRGRDGQRSFYRDDDRHQAVPQHRRYVNARDGVQQSHRGRGQPQLRKNGHRSRDPDSQRDRDLLTKDSKNVPEFDFEKANEEFSKLDLNESEKDGETGNGSENENREGATDSAEPTYQKNSFFDEISRDSRQTQRPKTSERSLNMQTFGAAASRRRPQGGRYYNRRPGNWTGSSGANGSEATTNGTAQVSA